MTTNNDSKTRIMEYRKHIKESNKLSANTNTDYGASCVIISNMYFRLYGSKIDNRIHLHQPL